MDIGESEAGIFMNKNSESKQFWRICGPLLLYWVIDFVARFIGELVVLIPHIGETVDYNKISGSMTAEQMGEVLLDSAQRMYEVLSGYIVEILAFAALCTIPLTLTLFLKDRKKEHMAGVPIVKIGGIKQYFFAAVLGAAFCIGMSCLVTMMDIALLSNGYQRTAENFYSAAVPVQIVCIGVIIPIAEELMYRGLLFKRFREKGMFWGAAFWSALIFGLSHSNTLQFLYAGLMGILLAYFYEIFGTIKLPIIFHVAANLSGILLSESLLGTWLAADPLRMAVVVIASSFIGSSMFVLLRNLGADIVGMRDNKPDNEDRITPDMFG